MAMTMSAARAGTIPYANIGIINLDTYAFTAESTGTLTAYFYGSTAGDHETLTITDATSGASATDLFPNQTTAIGATATLATTAGDTLVFSIDVEETGNTISSVPSANGDGDQHVYSTAFAGGTVGGPTDSGSSAAYIPAGTYIGFEDTLAGDLSDFNYADEQFVFTDTAISTNGGAAQITDAPEPASMMVLGSAFAGIGFARRKRRAA